MSKIIRNSIIFTSSGIVIFGIFIFISLAVVTYKGGGENLKPATYPNEHHFQTAVFWFELAESPEEIFQVLGDPQEALGKKLRKASDGATRYDILLIISYTMFFIFVFMQMRHLNEKGVKISPHSRRVLIAGIVLSVVMFIGDNLENFYLLKLTGYDSVKEIPDNVMISLRIWTRIKWGAIFMASAIMAFSYGRYFGFRSAPGLLFMCLYGITALLGMLSLSVSSLRVLIEISGNSLAIAWLASIVYAIILLKRNFAVRNLENAS